FIHEDGSPLSVDTYPSMTVLRTGQPLTGVVVGVPWENGAITWLSVNSQPLFLDGVSTPYAVVSTFFNITERKQAEERVRQSEARFRRMIENLPAGAVHVEGPCVRINKAIEAITGYSSTELATLDQWFHALFGDGHELVRTWY